MSISGTCSSYKQINVSFLDSCGADYMAACVPLRLAIFSDIILISTYTYITYLIFDHYDIYYVKQEQSESAYIHQDT